jgi:glucan biosynthesis protein C
MAPNTRLYSIDTLRALAMLLGVVLHASLTYKAGRQFNTWIIDPDYNSWFYDWLCFTINSFRMQLFFLLAGFFGALSIRKQSVRNFLVGRGRRLLLPLLVAMFTILPLTLAPFNYYRYQQAGIADPGAELIRFLKGFFPIGNHGLMHLWFIYYLLLYTAGLGVASSIFSKIKSGAWINGRAGFWTYATTLTILVALISQGYDSKVPTIWTGIKIPPVQFVYYGLFFVAGMFLETNRDIIAKMEKVYTPFLAAGIFLSIVLVILINIDIPYTPLWSAVYTCAFAAESVVLVIGLIGLFNARFNRPFALSELMAGSAYWVYLVHLPFVLFFNLILIDSWVPGPLRPWVVIILTTAVAISSYLLFVRDRWLGKFLEGK